MKTVVVDTSTLLTTGTELIDTLEDSVLVIPSVVVKELEDNRSKPSVGFLAREWLRLLEDLRKTHGKSVSEGVFVTDTVGVRVEPNHSNQKVLPIHLRDGSHDSTVLSVAVAFRAEGADVTLLSNDTPMRLTATLDLGLDANEFSLADTRSTRCFDGRVTVDVTETELLEYLNRGDDNLTIGRSVIPVEGLPSHCIVDVRLADGSLFSSFVKSNLQVDLLPSTITASSVTARNLEQRVALAFLKKPAETLPVVSVNGSAGTGKTLLTLAAALEAKASGRFKKVIVFRSLHEMGQGQELGFLPGDVNDKMSAWSGAVKDAFDVLKSVKGSSTSNDLSREVEVAPISFLRGRSLADTFVILDEAQNFSRKEILNVMSRIGQGSKIVIVSDVDQVDNRFLQTGARSDIWTLVEDLKDEPLFAHVTLKKTERSRVAETAARLLSSD